MLPNTCPPARRPPGWAAVEGRSGAMAMEVARAPCGPGQLMSLIIYTFHPQQEDLLALRIDDRGEER